MLIGGNSVGFVLFVTALLLGLFVADVAHAQVMYYEFDGMLVGEGEIYSSRTALLHNGNTNSWYVVPDEYASAGTFLNARGGKFIQSLPDYGSPGGPIIPPEVMYKMRINTPGKYRLYLRWECNDSVNDGGNSDSMFVDIVELKDGTVGDFGSPTNSIADWYEFVQNGDSDFATDPWHSDCSPEVNSAGAGGSSPEWYIPEPGVYTLRFSQREDGSAVDAFVFQRSFLPDPSGDGPEMSPLEPVRFVVGASADTYLRRSDTDIPHGTETSMAVKNDHQEGLSGLDRVAYMRFDISGLDELDEGVVYTNANLLIDLVNDGMNTNHNIFVAVIAEDAGAETFSETNLTPNTSDVWSEANDEGIDWSSIYGGSAVGSFEINNDLEGETITFCSAGLLNAVKDDNDGVLSLVVYRVIDSTEVDKFASKENTSRYPPRLEVQFWYPERGTLLMIL